jgi:hypothetical protein
LRDRSRFPGKDEERGLARILGVLVVAKHAAAHPQNHWPMALHQRLKG